MNIFNKAWGLLFLVTLLNSCNLDETPTSKKGHWIGEEKNKFRREFENSGLYYELYEKAQKGTHVDSAIEKISKLIYLRSEKQFSSLLDLHIEETEFLDLADKCLQDVLANGSVKGKWSKEDLNEIDFLVKSILNENYSKRVNKTEQDRFCSCVQEKSQELFPSYYDFSNDSIGMIELVNKCGGLRVHF